jgi:DNA-binding MarR family transcriptional regulator
VTRLAGELRTEVGRLAYHLRTPATRSGITPTRLAALAALTRYPNGVRQGDLAERMNMAAPSMTRLVEILEEAGWVERRRDPTDQRCLLLVLSPRGHTTVGMLRDEAATGSWTAERSADLVAPRAGDGVRRLEARAQQLDQLGHLLHGQPERAGADVVAPQREHDQIGVVVPRDAQGAVGAAGVEEDLPGRGQRTRGGHVRLCLRPGERVTAVGDT